jgi:hypothetical protein
MEERWGEGTEEGKYEKISRKEEETFALLIESPFALFARFVCMENVCNNATLVELVFLFVHYVANFIMTERSWR